MVKFENLPQAVEEIDSKMETILFLLNSIAESKQEDKEEPLYTVKQAASYLHLQPSTIYALTSRGDLKPLKGGKRSYYTKESLNDYLNGNVNQKRVES